MDDNVPTMDVPFEEWSPCEMWGHYFIDGVCTDCGEKEIV